MTDLLLSRTSITPLKHALRALCILSIAAPSLALAQTTPAQTTPSQSAPAPNNAEQSAAVKKPAPKRFILTGSVIREIFAKTIEYDKHVSSIHGLDTDTRVNSNTTRTTTTFLKFDDRFGLNKLMLVNFYGPTGVLFESFAGSMEDDTDKLMYDNSDQLYKPDGKTVLAEEIFEKNAPPPLSHSKYLKTISFYHMFKDCPSAVMTLSHKGDQEDKLQQSMNCTKHNGTSVTVDIPSETAPDFTVSYRNAHHALLKTVSYEADHQSPDKAHPSYRLTTTDAKTHKTETKPAPDTLSPSSYMPDGVPATARAASDLFDKTGTSLKNKAILDGQKKEKPHP